MGKNLMNPLKRISPAQHHSGTAQSPFCVCCPPAAVARLG